MEDVDNEGESQNEILVKKKRKKKRQEAEYVENLEVC